MLVLKDIVKNYQTGDTHVEALRGVSMKFRKSEFVAILGQSGCGKTTLLNIIGGLDQYSEGDLVINDKSTKEFSHSDWDTYRNHSIGFVFQSYNLIPHQTVLANVELALTLSGVSKAERRQRAADALTKVGLGDQLSKKPNQMSGGQMQRVAIARALVNNPDILLADEPTGALDSETSVQIMEILKEIAKEKLIIMVTHNGELAEEYATRTIRLFDGEVMDDSDPFQGNRIEAISTIQKKLKKTSMSFFTALSLSLNNLLTKKIRTFMTAFAGSIGIIGIALILAISTGAQNLISDFEENMLSSYPLAIEKTTMDMTSMMNAMMGSRENSQEHEMDKVYSADIMTDMINTMMSEMMTNDLENFKKFLESPDSGIQELVNDIQYGYQTKLHIFSEDTPEGPLQVNPSIVLEELGFMTPASQIEEMGVGSMSASPMMSNTDIWSEMIGNKELLAAQYEVLAGKMPDSYDEIVLIVDENNEITDYALYSLGLKDQSELQEIMEKAIQGETFDKPEQKSYTYDEILNLRFKLLINTDFFEKENGVWIDKTEDEIFIANIVEQAEEVKVVGILRPSDDAIATSVSGSVAYTSDLMKHLIEKVNASEIVKEQKNNPEIDVFSGLDFDRDNTDILVPQSMEELQAYIQTLPEEDRMPMQESVQQAMEMGMPEEQILTGFARNIAAAQQGAKATYDGNMLRLGVSDVDDPERISIYPKDFETKEKIKTIIEDYNTGVTNDGQEELAIQYTDLVGLLMSSVTTIIDVISWVLVAFCGISLVVSSIMIGIITYISVLERTKEIGILRSIGASKKDISRVFNAETLIVGFVSGAFGILFTVLLTLPINAIVTSLSGITVRAMLPPMAGIVLILISMMLTLIAGLIPSRIAANKDPVTALRSE